MLKELDLRGTPISSLRDVLPRASVESSEPIEAVRKIVADVRAKGDDALRQYAARFDGGPPDDFLVSQADLDSALSGISPDLLGALELAAENITGFHQIQRHDPRSHTQRGITIEKIQQPVDRAGCYVPGGRAAYPSTVLMTAIPAKIAGVPEVCLCVPPDRDGLVSKVTLAAACLAGVDEVYAVGGAQAIAALAYGSESIPAVDVIAGPGNVYVAIAKREVAGDVGVAAAFAGPSEIVVVADESAPAEFAAIDIVVQAEHGPGGLAWLLTWDERVARAVTREVERLATLSPRRQDIEATLSSGGYAVLVDGPESAVAVANEIAPEHLQFLTDNPRTLAEGVRHAGAVFCGALSPASVGDYVAGPSHVLPTNGTARFAGALSVADFCKDIHIITLDQVALDGVADEVAVIAEAEGLSAHAHSVRIRKSSK